jgi:hypothetical protein
MCCTSSALARQILPHHAAAQPCVSARGVCTCQRVQPPVQAYVGSVLSQSNAVRVQVVRNVTEFGSTGIAAGGRWRWC